ncbi:response regulator [Rubellimicrobium aerolatum]|uniref:Response regulator n=1 Tax=Rubellimicrobium aerolatum TaxID=490979 RepID=A0ABW0SEA3_9RHOB|nr:response regulator [Rubellimicrobium aerolatum]MBP1805684.1 DNA-binding NarL/FixJ family response regulator [Rubellimicrobium aerolatum]
MGHLDDLLPPRAPTADQPLAGLTLLLVEDSRLASEGVRLLCRRSGARLRRADSLATAERHLRGYRPDVALVDLHLPDGSGLDLIAGLARATPRLDMILGLSGDDALAPAAHAAGADGFLPKPLGLAAFQAALLARLPASRQPPARRPLPQAEPRPDATALREDLAQAARLLDGDSAYAARFLQGVARAAGDRALARAAEAATRGTPPALALLREAVATRLAPAARPWDGDSPAPRSTP